MTSCFLGAFPSVDLEAVCFVQGIIHHNTRIEGSVTVDESNKVFYWNSHEVEFSQIVPNYT